MNCSRQGMNKQQSAQATLPTVSIGMPVYNGERYLKNALDALLSQTFLNFELVISDNASTDKTEEICTKYAASDKRIRYVRQQTNIGATANFKFVLDEAQGEYFMWAACDDIRSKDFIEVNYNFLTKHPEYVASASPNVLEGKEMNQENLVTFGLDGEVFERFITFFKYCWISHGIFYSLIRAKALRDCEALGQSFLAADWAINLHLASKGKLNRTDSGYTIFGVKGVSSSAGAYKAFRNDVIEYALPFYRLSKHVMKLAATFTPMQKLRLAWIFFRLNAGASFDQLRTWLYSKYCRYARSVIRHN